MTVPDNPTYREQIADYVRMRWRVGGQVGRTIYAQAFGAEKGVLIGLMDTPELAADVVYRHNLFVRDDPYEAYEAEQIDRSGADRGNL